MQPGMGMSLGMGTGRNTDGADGPPKMSIAVPDLSPTVIRKMEVTAHCPAAAFEAVRTAFDASAAA